jgi:hypothetical protein
MSALRDTCCIGWTDRDLGLHLPFEWIERADAGYFSAGDAGATLALEATTASLGRGSVREVLQKLSG